MKKKRRNHISTIILLIVFFVGLSVMLYPTVSDFINSQNQRTAIIDYDKKLGSMEISQKDKLLEEADEYNQKLRSVPDPLNSDEPVKGYENVLDITGTGIMGYVTIPKIKTELPIYHGTSEEVLNVAVGHVQGSSLPVGGVGTHAVISAHRGLPSAKLFSDLDMLDVGDTFSITVLDRVIKYSIDKISIILPDEMSALKIEDDKDMVTLVTCTPYGINTHRLLVRGSRMESDEKGSVRVEADAFRVEPMLVAPLVGLLILTVLIAVFVAGGFSRKRRRRRELRRVLNDSNVYKNANDKRKKRKRHRGKGGDRIEK